MNNLESNQKNLFEPITWAAVAIWIAEAVVKEIATKAAEPVIRNLLGKEEIDFKALLQEAIDQIVNDVKVVVDDALDEEAIEIYKSKCNFIKAQLVLYAQTKDASLIRDMQIMSGEVTQQLYDKGIKAFGGLLIATNLHLLSLRALAETNPEWQQGLLDHFDKYANWLEERGNMYWQHMKSKVQDSCYCRPIPFFKGDYSSECDYTPERDRQYFFKYDFDAVESIAFRTPEECEDARFKKSDELELPALELYAHCRGLIRMYREFHIE
ncbi:hypothetical protein ACFWDG_04205 [Peribacillus sp. NPDC060186]